MKWEAFEYPWSGETGENTPFTVQSRENKRDNDNGHDTSVEVSCIQHTLKQLHFRYKNI